MPINHDDGEVSFEIVEEIGVLATYSTGWAKELNLVSWNGGPARYDIRDWDPRHNRMSRGITLQEKEMRTLVDCLRKRRTGTSSQSGQDVQEDSSDSEPVDTSETLC